MGRDRLPVDNTTSPLPADAKRSIDAIVKAFGPDLSILVLCPREREILEEAADIFVRLNGPDPQRTKDAEILSSLIRK